MTTEMEGLFCERIFGPINDWECHCGKYKRVRYKGIICERCGVEVIESNVRRHQIGFVELASPVTHVWYVKGRPSKIALILNISLGVLDFPGLESQKTQLGLNSKWIYKKDLKPTGILKMTCILKLELFPGLYRKTTCGYVAATTRLAGSAN